MSAGDIDRNGDLTRSRFYNVTDEAGFVLETVEANDAGEARELVLGLLRPDLEPDEWRELLRVEEAVGGASW